MRNSYSSDKGNRCFCWGGGVAVVGMLDTWLLC